ncbi:MAG: acyl-CoA carboxylase subunit epsilon [Streptomycetaceae bacterium]|nr:acyl-CoA carboxylase subunit epsilon [Streptomycetaceae bacterium]
MFKIIRGNPTSEELAAALAVVQARAAAGAVIGPGGSERLDTWADPARNIAARRMPKLGPKAWRSTYWPY